MMRTYSLLPCPIPRHEILEAMDSICGMFLEGCIIKFTVEVWIGQEVEDESVSKLIGFQGTSPREVALMVLYMLALVEKGGVSS